MVFEILDDVRRRGDDAVLDATERFDGYRLKPAEIGLSPAEIEAGSAALDPRDRDALQLAAERIRAFHEHRVPESWTREAEGERLGQQIRPLDRVGIYVPGFKAPLASTALMLAMPAAAAGVAQLLMCSPGRELHPAILEVSKLSGVARLYRIGGAQAVGALAYGTESVTRVDKIVGPGNPYVQAAKRQVFGEVGIDAEAGPSEVMIVADASAPAELLAADLLAQAEHDELSSVVLATPDPALARATLEELGKQLDDLVRRQIARAALGAQSAVIVTRSLEEALDLANRYAAEHLQLLVEEPRRWLERVSNAGAVFLGPYSPVPVGDYLAGPSHVLPTGGTARFFSAVGVEDFLKRTSVIELSEAGLRRLGEQTIRLAELEGLDAHARAVRRRLDDR